MKSRTFLLCVLVAVMLTAGTATHARSQQRIAAGVSSQASPFAAERARPASESAPSTPAVAAGSTGATVHITAEGLNPRQVSIRAGQAVKWVNQTDVTQRVVGGRPSVDRPFRVHLPLVLRNGGSGGPTAADGDQAASKAVGWGGEIAPGGSYSHTFSNVGDHPYFIADHSDWTGQVLVQVASTDVPVGLGGFEPHAAVVNPRNPSNVVVSQRNRLRISNDFGDTFPILVNSPAFPTGYGLCGDDVLAFDAGGQLWWSYLMCVDGDGGGFDNLATDDITIVVQQVNPTTGALVGGAIDVTPANHFDDKQWIAADANPASPFANNVYVHWTRFDTSPTQEFFSRCVNCATTNTFSAPSSIASGGGEGFRHQSHITTAPNGDVYASYHTNTCGSDETDGDIIIMRDSNGGADFAAGGNPPTGVFKTNIFGAGGAEVTCNRQPSTSTVPKARFLMQGAAAPFVVADPVRPGYIYVIVNDDPDDDAGTGDDGDVLLARSTDHGVNFTVSKIDHAPQGAASLQVFPQGASDQDGNLVVFWYDTRRQINNNAGTPANPADDYWNLDVYATVSRDAAQTFSNDFRINDVSFDPQLGAPNFQGDSPPTFRIGEYNGLAAVNGLGYATWTGNTATGQQILFDLFSILGVFPDRFEPNESTDFAVVTDLGSDNTYNESGLTIHSATDVDLFKVVALHTGNLQVDVEFNELINDLNARALDRSGTEVATGTITTLQPGSSLATLAIPVVQGEIYFVEVFDPNAPSAFPPQSTYDLTIVNRAAPTPFGLDLLSISDSGRDDADDVTNDDTPTIRVRADTVDAADVGIDMLTPADVAAGEDGYAVAVFRDGSFAGYASPVPGLNETVWDFTFPVALPDGTHSITAKVNVFDGATPQADGFGGESDALRIMIDTTAPPAPSIPDLLASSDSGDSDSDNVTKVNPPAFQGTGEANAQVRVRADGVVVGRDAIGTDLTDGVPGNGLGAWEITIEPLADGTYVMTAEAEDLAGNISAPSAAMDPPLVVDTPDGGGLPQRPTLDLVDAFDTGRSDQDNVTRLTTLDLRVSAETGTTVVIKDGNTGIDNFVMPAVPFTIRTLVLAEGPHPLSTESTDLAGNTSHQSEQLLVTVDATAPSVATPDLATSSDSAGVSDDDVTTISAPSFLGVEEVNALVRVAADGIIVGYGVVGSDLSDGVQGNGLGAYEVTVEPLDDGVYAITAQLEDLAGNVSATSSPLRVTIANQVLNLSGADADVVVNLDNHQVMGFPGYPSAGSVVGILGIPVVNLDVNGQTLTILGTTRDDMLTFTPLGAQEGSVTRDGSSQVINFAGVSDPFTVDTGSGVDTLTVQGTAVADAVVVTVDVTHIAQVNGLLAVNAPNVSVERLAISAGQGADTIDVTVFDTVNADLFVDAGDPAVIKPVADVLNVFAGSPRGHLQDKPGGPVPGSGSVLVTYPQTTDTTTRIDYAYVERVRLFK